MKAHWVALSLIPGIGGTTARKLVERFGTVEAVFEADVAELATVPRVTPDVAQRIRQTALEKVEAEIVSLEDEGMAVLTQDDENYPPLLRTVNDAPVVLFVQGQVRPCDERAVAIVGTRQPSERGRRTTEQLAEELAARGWTIVSGLALGIDTSAHRGALAADGGRTLAVLGSGLRVIHPKENSGLARDIVKRGALMSELHPATPPRGQQLMARDRIISGLARAVIVVEAGEKSGSLDTAAKARKQERLVVAAPGSPGTDQLIASGALRIAVEQLDIEAVCALIEPPSLPPASRETPKQASLW
jgi:DNA processing protein